MTGIMRRSVVASTIAALLASLTVGCGLLDVSNPTAIEDSELNNARGAELLRDDALHRLYVAVGLGTQDVALLTDEFLSDPQSLVPGVVYGDPALDQRLSPEFEALWNASLHYQWWQEARRAATLALPKLRAYALPGASDAYVGEMFTLRAYAAVSMAEDLCPGFPLHDIVDLKPVYGPALSTDEAFLRALADFDSAVAYAADSARILDFARVGRARALLGLGRLVEAAAAVNGVPTEYVRDAEFSQDVSAQNNPIPAIYVGGYAGPYSGVAIRSVANNEGGTGLDFVTAADPRVPTTPAGIARDGVTGLYAPAKYPDGSAPIALASGIEARLIEAEAALAAGGDTWRTIVNDLRATVELPALPDPGSPDTRLDLLFRERAFWLFATGHRLGDLRRLVRRYGRSVESVFPTGDYRLGGPYGTATSIPFPPAAEQPYNSAITGCTSR